MEDNYNVEISEQSSEDVEQSVTSSEQSSEVSDVSEVVDEPTEQVEELEDSTEEVEESEEDTEKLEEVEEVEQPKSTVIQVTENEESESGYDVTELDVESLNIMSQSYVDELKAVIPTSNDYYTFIESPIAEYFSGYMGNLPLNEYRAYHLRHWVSSGQYYSYYDDYYYLFYDYPDNKCIELKKYHDSNEYILTDGNAEILSSTITYGSDSGMSDLREGVNYVSWLSSLCVLASICVLYIVNAIFRHLRS